MGEKWESKINMEISQECGRNDMGLVEGGRVQN